MPFRMRILLSVAVATLLASVASAQAFRDPMRPAGAAPSVRASAPRAAGLKLEGVIAGPARVAIVNGRLVRAGDTIGGAIIVEVTQDGVRYSRGGRTQILTLPGARPNPGVRVARSEATTP